MLLYDSFTIDLRYSVKLPFSQFARELKIISFSVEFYYDRMNWCRDSREVQITHREMLTFEARRALKATQRVEKNDARFEFRPGILVYSLCSRECFDLIGQYDINCLDFFCLDAVDMNSFDTVMES